MSAGAAPRVLTIAGSDPSGGAGVQADLKTFSALGAYGCAVLTSLTAQSTQGVTGIHGVPEDFVRDQVRTLVDDVRLDAVKVGMLGTAAVADAVRELAADGVLPELVLDPVMVSTAGSRLLDEGAVDAVRELLPHAQLVTPNLPEAAVLLGLEPEDAATTPEQMREQAQRLLSLGCPRVLLKGGHLVVAANGDAGADDDRSGRDQDAVLDLLVVAEGHDEAGTHELTAPRVDTRHTHGTGCTLSSAIAALRPQHPGWLPAVAQARTWLTGALRHADELSVGTGLGPVHHFWDLWPRP